MEGEVKGCLSACVSLPNAFFHFQHSFRLMPAAFSLPITFIYPGCVQCWHKQQQQQQTWEYNNAKLTTQEIWISCLLTTSQIHFVSAIVCVCVCNGTGRTQWPSPTHGVLCEIKLDYKFMCEKR